MEPVEGVRTPEPNKKSAEPGGSTPYLRSPWNEPGHKVAWLKLTVAAALAFSLVLSWKLWISSRLFPLAPVSTFIPAVPFPLDYIWFLSLLGLLLAILVVRRPRWLVVVFIAVAGSLSLWDQNRWQPWFFQYLFMLAAIALAWNPGSKNQSAALDSGRLVIVFTYFWSGLQKLNANFVKETWPDFSGPLLKLLPEAARGQPAFLILAIPLLEVLIAFGLLTRRLRNTSVVLAIATHVLVLVLLISSGENTVVWPWNIAMALFVIILFWQDKETSPREIVIPRNSFHALVLLLFGALPALSFVDLWDSYLSSALYSGNTDQAVIYVSPATIDRLPPAIRPHIWQASQPFFLDVNRWSYGELNVPLYPEPRIYRMVMRNICEYAGSAPDIRLRIKEKPDLLSAARKSEYYDCDHL